MSKQKTLNLIIDKPEPLSDEQRAAFLSRKRYVRIVAGLGTGKTETLILCFKLFS
jgi:hypothetical protein